MKKSSCILWPVMALIALLLPACSGNTSADAGDLLGTIPSDASLVTVINSQSILEKMGCKVSGDKIEPGKDFQAMIERNVKNGDREKLAAVFNGETGVDPSVMAIFQVGYYTYLTGYLSDPAKFKTAVEENDNSKFATEEGIDVCKNIAVSNSQFWVSLEQGSIDPREIKHFTALDKTQSFLDNSYSSHLTEFSSDVEGWGNINGLLNTAPLGFQQRASMQMAIQMLFEDPSAFGYSIDFGKGKGDLTLSVLNGKGKDAKFQLPTQELDINALQTIGGKTNALFGIAVPNKLIKKLTDEVSKKGPSVFGEYLKIFQCLDGTIGAAINPDTKSGLGVHGFITTTGQDVNGLQNLLGDLKMNVIKDGKVLRVSEGDVTGNADVADLSKELKGAMLGIAITDPAAFGSAKVNLNTAVFTLVPDGDTLRVKISGRSSDDKENFLLSLIRTL